MYIVVEVIKFLGAVLAAAAAVAGTYLDGTKSVESGNLTKRGRIVVASAILGVLISGSAQIAQMINAQATAEAVRQRNEQTAARLERIPRLIARQNYPLEPVELLFTIEYPMNQAGLEAYADRVRGDIVEYLREGRGDRRATSDSLEDENVLFVLTNNEGWKPELSETERAALELFGDNTSFSFAEASQLGSPILTLTSTSTGIGNAIVTMRKHGEITQHIELLADFSQRVFVKKVWCTHPVRTGTDAWAFSALDLIGREMTWTAAAATDLQWTLLTFGARFSYDYGFGQN